MKSRDREAAIIRQANRASAVGKLFLGEFNDWADFLKADTDDLCNLPRKMLKAGKADVKKRLSKEINNFCCNNFVGMDQSRLSALYEVIKAHRGFEMPLHEFENKFAKVRSEVLDGSPRHCTVDVSLWGLRLKFPEYMLADDVAEALAIIKQADRRLAEYKGKTHLGIRDSQKEIAIAMRLSQFGSRMCLLSCFNLVEAFLNGLAWDFSKEIVNIDGLSERKRKLLEDGEIREKLLKYPEIISGRSLWSSTDEPVRSFLEQIKPFRDSLVHPSPFSKPERYGGIDKLEHLYRVDAQKAVQAAKVSAQVIQRLHAHVKGSGVARPEWLRELLQAVGGELD